MAKKRARKVRKAGKKTGRKSPLKGETHLDILDILHEETERKKQRVFRAAKVGVVTALVGGIFKAISLTQTFPEPFDTIGNLILFLAFLLMLAAFLLGRY